MDTYSEISREDIVDEWDSWTAGHDGDESEYELKRPTQRGLSRDQTLQLLYLYIYIPHRNHTAYPTADLDLSIGSLRILPEPFSYSNSFSLSCDIISDAVIPVHIDVAVAMYSLFCDCCVLGPCHATSRVVCALGPVRFKRDNICMVMVESSSLTPYVCMYGRPVHV